MESFCPKEILEAIEAGRQRLRAAIRECMYMAPYHAARKLRELLGVEGPVEVYIDAWPEWFCDYKARYEKAAMVYFQDGPTFVLWKGFTECVEPDPYSEAITTFLLSMLKGQEEDQTSLHA